MASTIELAKKGSVKDMTALYHGVKAEVYGLCRLLLDNEKTASSAVAPIFQNLWDSLLAGEIASQEAFEKKATAKTIAYCVTKTKKKNPKAFQPPKDGGDGLALGKKLCLEGQPWELVLGNLTDLARFLFVLHGVCGYDAKRLAALLEWKPEAVQKILDGEEQTVASICDAVSTHKKIPFAMTAEELHQQWKAQTQQDALPETAQRAVLGRIDSLCFSIRKKSKRNKILAGVIAGIVVVACAVVGIVLGVNHASAAPDYYADIQIQDYGTVTVELDADAAPITVENFVNLARSGFYDGLTFHRIMDGFMMQGGDPEGNGTGGSDTTIKGEFSANGVENNLSHTRGAISMARSSDYDSASSQFFIVQEDSTFLDGQYACFGYVTEGMDIVDEICESAQPTDDNGTIPADEQPVITSITIREGE